MQKDYKLSYKQDIILISVKVNDNTIVGNVKIKHKDFKTTVNAKLLDSLVKINQAITKRDIKLLCLHIIDKCTPFAFDNNHNTIADKNIIRFINP